MMSTKPLYSFRFEHFQMEIPYTTYTLHLYPPWTYIISYGSGLFYMFLILIIFPFLSSKLSTQAKNSFAKIHHTLLFVYSFISFISTLYYLLDTNEIRNWSKFLCSPIPSWLRLISITFTLSKIWEWMDTAILIWKGHSLSKIGFLHIYHHATTFLLFLCAMNFPGAEKSGMLLNGFVHTLMYYHFAFRLPKFLRPLITTLQIVQLLTVTYVWHIVPSSCPADQHFPKKNFVELQRSLKINKKIKINGTNENEYKSLFILKHLLRFGDTADYLMILLGIIVAIVYAIGHLFFVQLFGELVSLFVSRVSIIHCPAASPISYISDKNSNINNDSFHADVHTKVIHLVVIGLIQVVFSYLQYVSCELSATRLTNRMRIELLKATFARDISYFDTTETSINNFFDNIAIIQSGIGWQSSVALSSVIFLIGSLILAFITDWKLTLIVIIAEPLSVGAAFMLSKLTAQTTMSEIKSYGDAGQVAQEVFTTFRTVTAFNAQDNEEKRYASKLKYNTKYALRKGFIYGCYVGIISIFTYWTTALGFLAGIWLKSTGRHPTLNITQIVVVVTCITEGLQFLGYLAPSMKAFFDACNIAAPIIRYIEDTKIDNTLSLSMKPSLQLKTNQPVDIVFENVSFSYPNRKKELALNNISFKVKAGTTVALVGSSGSGKSTCVQLLLRFYDSNNGHININGRPIQEYDKNNLRQIIGLVSQESILFATSVKENISYGKDNSTFEEVIEAAKQANAHEFIMKLPHEYDTLVGERGVQLSGGQRQRIALARALICQPSLLLLDEATSALDSSSEKLVQETLDRATQNRTTIIVAHRLSTIRYADWIIVIKEGSIVEQGSHDDLMTIKQFYYELVNKQQMKLISSEIRKVHVAEEIDQPVINDIQLSNNVEETITEVPQTDSNSFYSLMKLFKLNAPEWPYLLIVCLTGILSGGSYPAFAYSLAEMISSFEECTVSAQMDRVIVFTRIIFILGIAILIIKIIHYVCLAVAGVRLTNRIRVKIFGCMLRQEVGWYDRTENNTGTLCARLSTDALAIQSLTSARLGLLIESLSLLVIALIIGLIFSWQLTLLVFGLIIFAFIFAIYEVQRKSKVQTLIETRLANASEILTQSVRSIRTVFQLNRQQHILNEFKHIIDQFYDITQSNVFKGGISFALSYPIATLILPCLAELAVNLLDKNLIDPERIVLLFAFVPFAFDVIQVSTMISAELGGTTAAARDINQLFERIPLIDNMATDGKILEKFSGSIQFDSIVFSYPTRKSVKVLDGFQLTIQPGQSVALVGSSGCGKSTIAQLLERFYDSNQGRVLVDGYDIKTLNLSWLRSQIGLVSQEPALVLGLSIGENISYGCLSNTFHQTDIIDVAKRAHCHDFIEQLPQGYNTLVGLNGTSFLSGGEKQRIAIARALFRKPKILLLDEATSALDVHNEQLVEESLNAARQDDPSRTVIIVAHRLSTIQSCDLICVLGPNGRLLESGTHTELMARGNAYYRFAHDHVM
ncbi:unnamed protein product [Adineta steineri]|uniref:Very-long-chain 3-oxoacyl-CoA synthase n=1 Tax=Adineta steineri TaxID=433720 RepID=A0A819MMC3_9BILA|nr:unnamed protein product [Adineta steineri]